MLRDLTVIILMEQQTSNSNKSYPLTCSLLELQVWTQTGWRGQRGSKPWVRAPWVRCYCPVGMNGDDRWAGRGWGLLGGGCQTAVESRGWGGRRGGWGCRGRPAGQTDGQAVGRPIGWADGRTDDAACSCSPSTSGGGRALRLWHGYHREEEEVEEEESSETQHLECV